MNAWKFPWPFLLLPLLGSIQSCCGLYYALGCAPEQRLERISYDSPEECLKTFLAAIRSGDTKTIYESLGEDFKKRNGLSGLGFEIAWERIKKDSPWIQGAGEARIRGIQAGKGGSQIFLLEAFGQNFRIETARYGFWEVGRRIPPEEPGETEEISVSGEYVQEPTKIWAVPDPEKGRIVAVLQNEELENLRSQDIAFLRLGWTWRVKNLLGAIQYAKNRKQHKNSP
jgi:hypothetical protein